MTDDPPISDEREIAEFRFGQEMLKHRLITDAQLKTVLEYRESLGGRVQDIVLKFGFVDDDAFSRFMARREQVPSIDLELMQIDRELMSKIPRRIIEEHHAIPFRLAEDLILLVTSEPYDLPIVEDIQFLTNCRVEIGLAPLSLLREKINRFYAAEAAEASEASAEAIDMGDELGRQLQDTESAGSAVVEDTAVADQAWLQTHDVVDPPDLVEVDDALDRISLGERLACQIHDPVVAALARVLLRSGHIDPEEWTKELGR